MLPGYPAREAAMLPCYPTTRPPLASSYPTTRPPLASSLPSALGVAVITLDGGLKAPAIAAGVPLYGVPRSSDSNGYCRNPGPLKTSQRINAWYRAADSGLGRRSPNLGSDRLADG